LTANTVRLMVSKLSKQLPFTFSSHKLRHNSAINYCLDQYEKYGTIDIYKLMALLGHEDIKTTRRYLHLANQIIASKSNISHMDKVIGPNLTENGPCHI
jgi:site-specific recombinase XerD